MAGSLHQQRRLPQIPLLQPREQSASVILQVEISARDPIAPGLAQRPEKCGLGGHRGTGHHRRGHATEAERVLAGLVAAADSIAAARAGDTLRAWIEHDPRLALLSGDGHGLVTDADRAPARVPEPRPHPGTALIPTPVVSG